MPFCLLLRIIVVAYFGKWICFRWYSLFNVLGK